MNHAGLDPLQYRLSCIHTALAALQPRDAASVKRDIEETESSASIHVDYSAGKDDAAILMEYETLFHNINHLRDAAKNWADHTGREKKKVEELVDRNGDLGICVDVANGLKHVKLYNDGRTSLVPTIGTVSSGLKLTVGPKPRPIPGLAIRIDECGRPRAFCNNNPAQGTIVTEAEIIDKDGNRIGDALDIAKRAIEAWRLFLSDWGINLAPDT